ncbi:MAG: arginase family protein [Patescibacteria group bacterium]
MITWLPHLAHEPFPYDPECHLMFDRHRAESNISYLVSTFGMNDERVAYLLDIFADYSESMSFVRKAGLIQEQAELLSIVDMNYAGTVSNENEFNTLIKRTIDIQKPTVFLSDTHSSTGLVLSVYEKNVRGNTKFRTGVVCVDSHADLYDHSQPLWKGNVFSSLIHAGTVQAMVIVGVPHFRQISIRSELTNSMNQRVVMLEDLNDRDEVNQAIAWLGDQNINQVFYSIDLDGLTTRKLQLTAMEYCPFHILLNLAKYELTGLNKDQIDEHLDDIIRPPSHQQLGRRNLFHIGDNGLNTGELIKFLEICFGFFSHKGINNGIKVDRHSIVGDIVELFGPDVGSRTAVEVAKIAQALLVNSAKYSK